VDDIIFGINDDKLSKDFATKMQSEFEMSMLGELTYIWGFRFLSRIKEYSYIKPSTSRKCSKNSRWKIAS